MFQHLALLLPPSILTLHRTSIPAPRSIDDLRDQLGWHYLSLVRSLPVLHYFLCGPYHRPSSRKTHCSSFNHTSHSLPRSCSRFDDCTSIPSQVASVHLFYELDLNGLENTEKIIVHRRQQCRAVIDEHARGRSSGGLSAATTLTVPCGCWLGIMVLFQVGP